MKDKLRDKNLPAFYYIIFLTIENDSPKALNPPRTILPNLMSSSFVVMPEAQKVMHKSFLDLELDLEKSWEPNFWLMESPNLKRLMPWSKTWILRNLVTLLGVKIKYPNPIRVNIQTDFKLRYQHPKRIPVARVWKSESNDNTYVIDLACTHVSHHQAQVSTLKTNTNDKTPKAIALRSPPRKYIYNCHPTIS